MSGPDHNQNYLTAKRRRAALRRAALICPIASIALGFGAARLLKNERRERSPAGVIRPAGDSPARDEKMDMTIRETPRPPAETVRRSREQFVPGGVAFLGGDDEDLPPRKVFVEAFWIGETEVTNDQYEEFVRETNRPSPFVRGRREEGGIADGAREGSRPVTNVSWRDAADYCRWLSGKIKAEVRLPTEAEWTLAAGGPQRRKYPWGDEWDERAVAGGAAATNAPHAVKSYPLNRSPYGAYDMAGNVWEWVEDGAGQSHSENEEYGGERVSLRTIKGGAIDETPEMIRVSARAAVSEESRDALLGFRYVVTRRTPQNAN